MGRHSGRKQFDSMLSGLCSGSGLKESVFNDGAAKEFIRIHHLVFGVFTDPVYLRFYNFQIVAVCIPVDAQLALCFEVGREGGMEIVALKFFSASLQEDDVSSCSEVRTTNLSLAAIALVTKMLSLERISSFLLSPIL